MIYLDHNATTPIDPAVRAAITRCLDHEYGNPSSLHEIGQQARRVVDQARAQVAAAIAAKAEEIFFTSGGTEADNLGVVGAALAAVDNGRRHIVTSAIEHQAVLEPCEALKARGFEVTLLAVDAQGRLDLDAAKAALRDDTALVSLMLANNDVGTLQPVTELAAAAHERGAVVHCDAVQALGKTAVDVGALGVDLLSISAHKIYGPKGIGALYRRPGVELAPLVFGGQQQQKLRPGTENVPGIVGFGCACELATTELAAEQARLTALRDGFEAAVLARIPDATINGGGAPRLANTSNIGFRGLEGEMLAINLDLLGVAISTGAACSTADREPSHVLLAMGQSEDEARSALRFSFGKTTDEGALARAVEAVCEAVSLLGGSVMPGTTASFAEASS